MISPLNLIAIQHLGQGTPNGDLSPAIPNMDEDGGITNVADEDNVNGAAGDRFGGIQNLTGSAHGDALTGDGAANTLMGMGGNDMLVGGAGDDTLMGGEGDDTLSADSGMNTLVGGAGDDTISGGSDDDTITGGPGDDQMSGGGGDDTFVFSPSDGDGDDVITGFTVGDDRIDLSAYLLTAEQVAASIDVFGGNVRIDLTEHGGGKIILSGVTDIESLDEATGDDNNAGTVETLNEYDATTNDDGVFIL